MLSDVISKRSWHTAHCRNGFTGGCNRRPRSGTFATKLTLHGSRGCRKRARLRKRHELPSTKSAFFWSGCAADGAKKKNPQTRIGRSPGGICRSLPEGRAYLTISCRNDGALFTDSVELPRVC